MARILVIAGALFGFLGILSAAAAAHLGTPSSHLHTVSLFFFVHAPLLLAIPVLIRSHLLPPKSGYFAAGLTLSGVIIFSSDLTLRALKGTIFFPLAAPLGGLSIMGGWLMIIIAALCVNGKGEI